METRTRTAGAGGWKRLVVVGTGTGIGKSHVAAALVEALRGSGVPGVGLKPVESGYADGGESDQAVLRRASECPVRGGSQESEERFHVKHFLPAPYLFPDPVSPHLAARAAAARIDPAKIVAWLAAHPFPQVIETAGGLFSPLAPNLTNLALVQALAPDHAVLVAPDRLGVLHDVTATIGYARHLGLGIAAVALSAPPNPDASTGRNAAELCHLGLVAKEPILFPRAPLSAPETREAAAALLARLT